MSRLLCLVGGLVLGLGLGILGSHFLQRGSPLENTVAAPAVVQKDGSVIAERAPLSEPAPSPHLLPKASIEERRISAIVRPSRTDCPAVRIDASLVQVDGGKRVVISSPDGEVTHAIDMPIIATAIAAPLKRWAIGTSYDPISDHYGAWIERDLGRLRLGADIKQSDHGSAEAWLRVGFTF